MIITKNAPTRKNIDNSVVFWSQLIIFLQRQLQLKKGKPNIWGRMLSNCDQNRPKFYQKLIKIDQNSIQIDQKSIKSDQDWNKIVQNSIKINQNSVKIDRNSIKIVPTREKYRSECCVLMTINHFFPSCFNNCNRKKVSNQKFFIQQTNFCCNLTYT